MYKIYCKLRDSIGVKDANISKETGITRSTFTDWKNGRSEPKQEKLQKIASYFGVSIEYLITGEDKEAKPYYFDDDVQELAKFLHQNPDHKVLFNSIRNVKKEDIMFIKEMIDRFTKS